MKSSLEAGTLFLEAFDGLHKKLDDPDREDLATMAQAFHSLLGQNLILMKYIHIKGHQG